MAKISIKTDFKDGDKLFSVQLNNNFKTIQEAWDVANGIVWQGDTNEDAIMYKGTTAEIADKSVVNGQLLWNTETGETYLDANDERINTGSGNVVSISASQPTNAATKLWVDTEEPIDKLYYNEGGTWKELLSQPSGDTVPIGSIAQFGGSTAPTNWLFCDGSAVSRVTYAELFAVIGTTYGAGDGSTTFNIPNDSGKLIKAKQSAGIVGDITTDITDENDNAVPNAKTVKEYVDNTNTYSTAETVVGTWIDGKPIYRKVFEFTTGANNTFINVDFNEKSVVDKVVKLEGCFRRDSDIFVFNTYRSSNAYTTLLFSQINGLSVLVYQPESYYSNKPAWAMIEYTKTTD